MAPLRKFPWYGYAGIVLMVVFWYLIWNYNGLRAHWAFFPLWLGYILSVNALTTRLKGHSLINRNFSAWLMLFIISAPVWWMFEGLNYRAHYWIYTEVSSFTALEYHAFATWNFSTVIPAIFGTAELAGAVIKDERWNKGLKIGRTTWFRVLFLLLGIMMLIIFLWWPKYGAAFLWMSIFFILDPINHYLGYPSLLKETAQGHWRTILVLWLASIICGFFWEFWNYYASPKWLYQVPLVDFWHVFEMPLLGYLGYLPFALELYALYHLVLGVLGKTSPLEFGFRTHP